MRELRNVIDRAVVLTEADVITVDDLPQRLRGRGGEAPAGDLRDRVAAWERSLIEAALDATDNNQTRAAERLGVPLRTLVYKLGKLGIHRRPPR